jgi:tetratricopeptide (TPR) repeat protein
MRLLLLLSCAFFLMACQSTDDAKRIEGTMTALGSKQQLVYENEIARYATIISKDSNNIDGYTGLCEVNVYLYIFGLKSRDSTIPKAKLALDKARAIDATDPVVMKLVAIMHFLDWNWDESRMRFMEALRANPDDLNARHWYSLFLVSQGDIEGALKQSDTLMAMDAGGDYLIGRGSLFYFARRNSELRDLMVQVIEKDPASPWAYDWLGMAYCELKEFDQSVDTYLDAFDLSDGLAEVGAGLGHALGLGGRINEARILSDYYSSIANESYVPQVQRAFIHIGTGEYDTALDLLEEAYREKSWFIIFIQIEPWYDPVRKEPRFNALVEKMNFPQP